MARTLTPMMRRASGEVLRSRFGIVSSSPSLDVCQELQSLTLCKVCSATVAYAPQYRAQNGIKTPITYQQTYSNLPSPPIFDKRQILS